MFSTFNLGMPQFGLVGVLFMIAMTGSGGPAIGGDSWPDVADDDSARAASGFDLVWDSGNLLTSSVTVGGDVDGDGRFDFVGSQYGYPSTILRLFEADGAGGYGEVWNSPEPGIVAAYSAFAYGDTDADGRLEILAAEVSTFNSIVIFEATGDNLLEYIHRDVREPSQSADIARIMVGDTDLDGHQEIIIVREPEDGTFSSLVAIWEHTGTPGEHTYTRVFTYTSLVRLWNGVLGDVDHDGYPDIVLGPAIGSELSIRRLEYSPAQSTWRYQHFEIPIQAESYAPGIGDVDGDGRNELLYGNRIGGVLVVESTGENRFVLTGTTREPQSDTDVKAIAVLPVQTSGHRRSLVAASTWDGHVGVWTMNSGPAGFIRIDHQQFAGPVTSLAFVDDGDDGRAELVMAIRHPSRIEVYRQRSASVTAVADPPLAGTIAALPNPFNPRTTIHYAQRADGPIKVGIFDLRGRTVKMLTDTVLPAGEYAAVWDGCDAGGRSAPTGTYLVRLDSASGRESIKISLVR